MTLLRIALLAAPILALACGDEDSKSPDDTGEGLPFEFSEDATICGTVELANADTGCAELPGTVNISEVLDQMSACAWRDTGAPREWGSLVDAPSVVGQHFESFVPPGDYGVWVRDAECDGCLAVTTVDGACQEVTLTVRQRIYVDAPNVYLYPPEPTFTQVRLPDPEALTATWPDYPRRGWSVLARPDGQLESRQGTHDYLFYELAFDPQRFQRDEGWCAPGALAQASIEQAMELYGFLDHEIDDFSEFWDGEFPPAPWITVYPQVDTLPWIGVQPEPDSFLRAWFVLRQGCHPVDEPVIEPVDRWGFHAAEWGVAALPPLEGAQVVLVQ
jgi:hypothetical protein